MPAADEAVAGHFGRIGGGRTGGDGVVVHVQPHEERGCSGRGGGGGGRGRGLDREDLRLDAGAVAE